jgi:hypothetical protein
VGSRWRRLGIPSGSRAPSSKTSTKFTATSLPTEGKCVTRNNGVADIPTMPECGVVTQRMVDDTIIAAYERAEAQRATSQDEQPEVRRGDDNL